MKKLLGLLTLCLVLTGCGTETSNQNSTADSDGYTIGIVQHMPHPALDSATTGFKDFLNEKGITVTLTQNVIQAGKPMETKGFLGKVSESFYLGRMSDNLYSIQKKVINACSRISRI